METPDAFEIIRRTPSERTRHLVSAIAGYRETRAADHHQRETAGLVVPLIISLGTPFRIALGREPHEADRVGSFAAGLYAGPVDIRSDGSAACVQVDFTPLGAYRCLGGAVVDLCARMVDAGDVFRAAGRALVERVRATPSWHARFDLVEDFVASRDDFAPSPAIAYAWRRLAATGGAARIAGLAEEIGWSRTHLAERFRVEIGVGPKRIARMMRFRRACVQAQVQAEAAGRWARIAASCGYADQAHLIREFVALAGEPPGAWARRVALRDPRLRQPDDPAFG
ncbi:helix-turn-helix domain-containing protein [Elioraea rosea]|uniref:helix-turn-helix domain-containing protein n=1 Tax=Elioraea rosea TaxID=2492390 RepID=UPI001950FCBF|nr:AraC family transcriptional regulator [Elioraea rosea]